MSVNIQTSSGLVKIAGTPTIDTALSNVSKNPVQNKVVTEKFDEINSNLDGLGHGENGAKNLFKDYDVMQSYTISSETYNGYPVIYSDQQWEGAYQSDLILKSGVTYTISAYVKGNGYAYVFSSSKDGYIGGKKIALTDNFKRFSLVYTPNEDVSQIRIENGGSGLYIACFQIEEGDTVTPYKPYIPSVKMLADEVLEQNESLSAIGKCKNLLNSTLQTTTTYGVTCTDNGDGTYTLNGTSTAKLYFTVGAISTVINNGKTFKLTGCPVGGSTSTYYIVITDSVNPESVATDYGTGAIKTIKKFDNKDITYIFIAIESGVTLNNVVFKPMLTSNLSATYDYFVPYTGDGETLTHDVAEIKNDLSAVQSNTILNYESTTVDLDSLTGHPLIASVNTGATNAPTGFGGGYMIVVYAGSSSAALYQTLVDVVNNKTYRRSLYHGSWSDWSLTAQ